MSNQKSLTLLDPELLRSSFYESFKKLSPSIQWKNPVMFVVYLGSILTTFIGFMVIDSQNQYSSEGSVSFIFSISAWLWFTVLFANFAESLAEGRSKAQAASLKGLKKSTIAKKLSGRTHDSKWESILAENLKKGDVVLVETSDTIPLDGEVIQGVATVDESAITGESAPVVRLRSYQIG